MKLPTSKCAAGLLLAAGAPLAKQIAHCGISEFEWLAVRLVQPK